MPALKTRLWVGQGRLTEALAWARERGLSVDDDLSYLREFEHITLVKVLIARYKSDRVDGSLHEAMGLLTRLLQAAEEGRCTDGKRHRAPAAASARSRTRRRATSPLVSLQRALTLAEPAGYVRLFVDEGLPMAQLLAQLLPAAARGIMPDYIKLLLALSPAPPAPPAPPAQPLIEPLSQRELEVLQLIAQGLSNGEISERLFLALSTVKGHNRRFYGKLQLQRRTEAVARARELALL